MLVTNDGLVIRGISPEDIIDELNAVSFSSRRSRRQFMEEMASRAQLQTGQRVRTSSPARFVEDLIAIGILISEED